MVTEDLQNDLSNNLPNDLSIELSTVGPQIKVIDDKRAVRYRVVAEPIDLEALRRERKYLQSTLEMPEPSVEELIEIRKANHPYYQNKEDIIERIEQITALLGG